MLTRQASELSSALEALDDVGKRRAVETIRAISNGVTSLNELPDTVLERLWALLLTLGRKSVLGGADTEALIVQIENGLSEEFRELIRTHYEGR